MLIQYFNNCSPVAMSLAQEVTLNMAFSKPLLRLAQTVLDYMRRAEFNGLHLRVEDDQRNTSGQDPATLRKVVRYSFCSDSVNTSLKAKDFEGLCLHMQEEVARILNHVPKHVAPAKLLYVASGLLSYVQQTGLH